ncbi:hypothetical protein [Dysgonomonas sp. 520]|uniref:hypothetical protein n=1 Tax=Dysgonomonas sp. 520 TaxID=2302931 RepID=UPI0013D61B5C|nr:hypothetical protein [Dysgonomonas sp. 520]NDW10230.1 hypothetical protein [Dysgonomonas sp. 520]
MKKTLLFVAALAMTLGASAQELITFTEAGGYTADTKNGSFTFKATETDKTDKPYNRGFEIDGNTAYFYDGDLTTVAIGDCDKFDFRLKSGGASKASYRYIILDAKDKGTLKIAARTGSNSATDRTVVVAQAGKELYNKVVVESSAQAVSNPSQTDPSATSKVYPYINVEVPAAGEVTITFPVSSINIYSLSWATEGTSSISDATADKGAVVSEVYYNLQGKQVAADAKGLVLKKVTYENGSVETVKQILD